jgi:hypothetical protein
LVLNATVTQSQTSGTAAQSTSHTERFVAEASSGNWAAEVFAAGGQGCAVDPSRPVASCEPPSLTWAKVMYKAGSDVNRTFVISGTVSAGGEGEVVRCYSQEGEADGVLQYMSPGMAWIFSEVVDGDGRRFNCVGEGGIFAMQAGVTQIGFTSATVYEMAAEFAAEIVLPGMAAPNIVVAEAADADVPNVPVSLGGVTKGTVNATGGLDVSSFQVLYSGWNASAPPFPADYWIIPPTCFQNGGGGGWRVGQQQQQQQKEEQEQKHIGNNSSRETRTALGVRLPRK